MNLLKTEKGEKSTVKLEFAIDKEVFEAAVEKVYRKQVKKINVPGFRAGKAPRAIVEKMYGKGVFYEDAINDLIPDNYTAAVKEAGLDPVGQPEIDIVSIDDNGLFISNGKIGEVTAQLVCDGVVKGSASINIVEPDAIAFGTAAAYTVPECTRSRVQHIPSNRDGMPEGS